jgi:hypothetical protein
MIALSPRIRHTGKLAYESLHLSTLFRSEGQTCFAKFVQQLACMLGCADRFAIITCSYPREESLRTLVFTILGHAWRTLSRRESQRTFDFLIEVSRDCKCFDVSVLRQETRHPVIWQVHAVCALIHENRDRGVRAGVRNVFSHFFHDERIAHYDTHHPGPIATRFLAQNRTMVKLRKGHKPRSSYGFSNDAFQFVDSGCLASQSPEVGHVRMSYGLVDRSQYLVEGF